MFEGSVYGWVIGIGTPVVYVLGLLHAYDAIMKTRTAQGATAWAISLVTIPLVAIPLYWIFGRAKFDEYIQALRGLDEEIEVRLGDARRGVLAEFLAHPEDERGELQAFHRLATLPFTRANGARLLINGEATFEAIFAAIERAERYVLAQFYIIHDDEVGRQFKERLLAKARQGVPVYLLYDEIGCYGLPRAYVDELREAGVRVSDFGGKRSWLGRFRLNFRNHRKIVVVDGVRGYMGGLNVGDEYLGRDPKIGPWRDTHIALEGPSVQGLQYAFLKDWYYGRGEVIEVTWEAAPAEADLCALVLASGPADRLETCGLLFAHAIESAERRVWIATPYFVPDGAVLGALQLAALRGVDVRLLMPRKTDAWMFKYVPYAYLPDVTRAGVKAYLYEEGFMHQKVLLVDDDYAAVSTANLDNRSFRLNFELTVLLYDGGFCGEVERMLEADLARATEITEADLERHPFGFRLAVQATRLMSPVL
ncbi:MAG TPA: cardiolipin synthase [Rubricoccaceae bacterium]|nr:cardiolipin synthase [Rubricoccaceae bacterium]